jgi:hypothetical protein
MWGMPLLISSVLFKFKLIVCIGDKLVSSYFLAKTKVNGDFYQDINI